jgi:hypothetical protein
LWIRGSLPIAVRISSTMTLSLGIESAPVLEGMWK